MSTAFRMLLSPQRLTDVVDVGANPIDGEPPYAAMLAAGLCRVTGFEPQQEALLQLETHKGPDETYLPYAIGDGETHTLKICRSSGMTSLYEPDATALRVFGAFEYFGEVIERVEVHTRRLDEVPEVEHVDFLKVDAQGSELAVLRGAKAKLAEAVAIQTEISFVTLYQDQPGLGDVDLELRGQGFIPHCFTAIKQWPIAPCVVNNDPSQALNQLLEADIVYVREFTRAEAMDDEQLKHLALIAHHCYRSVDLALRCVMVLEQRNAVEAGAQQRYMEICAASE
ncbi:FkbM family methyltransferase [Mycobacterium sp. ACS4054]|uniref:FkbM family methyltransferase n=1 Tax=Mycobacterium sp. ACS4054 TaxID=1834119 RepID=UPI0007FC61C9|nr:FkbM family methyltransferase [Mycobacterium sp. ACS4054]OBF03972.1 FkbM family methyltransferase [Mycobacterium sp. ACS4054]